MAYKKNESIRWLDLENSLPVWSRRYQRNTTGNYRDNPLSKFNKYDVEIEDRLWSLWGNLHPEAPVFERRLRGRQYLAIYVVACCTASVFNLTEWSGLLLDKIVANGTKYFEESISKGKGKGNALRNLSMDCALESLKFVVYIDQVCCGQLYRYPTRNHMNLCEALNDFFSHHQFGILKVHKRALAIGLCLGEKGGYFMYDCQEKGYPVFTKQKGGSYLLRTRHLHVLHYCIVVTLNMPNENIKFSIHRVAMLREEASLGAEEEQRFLGDGDQ
ncbi:uncharacterized protein LOC135432748 [Drosophila montana]|uniref:uncharacterized protein LOC135432748 n=1 Tax=Drosophila montana TaxID=40370 RepID=UPI00313E56B4